jgi:redox-sensing transcriptional repressor
MPEREVRISRAMLARLPFYYRTLAAHARAGNTKMSSAQLAASLGMDSAQVRRDLSSIGEFGRPGIGYNVPELIEALEEMLGLRNRTEAVLVGVGRLGAALFGYPGFEAYGLRIVGLFDSDPERIGAELDGTLIRSVSEIPHVVRRLSIQMGIITTPPASAQEIADMLVEAGVIAIWNFAPVSLSVPPGVMVRDEDLAAGLSHLSRHLSGTTQGARPEQE